MEEETWYECDPDLNPECRKTTCYRAEAGRVRCYVGKPCRITRKREAARLDENGEPVKIADRRLYYLGQQIGADEMQRVLDDMERILAVGIVNARKDLKTIEDAIRWLKVLKGIW